MGPVYDKVYLCSLLSGLKILEIVVLTIAFSTVLSFDLEVEFDLTYYSRLRFFILVTALTWVVCVVIFFLNLTRALRNLPVPWHWVNLIFGIIFSLFLLLASAFVGNTVINMNTAKERTLEKKTAMVSDCQYLTIISSTSCTILEVGVVFGCIAMAVFIGEVLLCSQKLRRGDYSHDTPIAQPSLDNATVSSFVGTTT